MENNQPIIIKRVKRFAAGHHGGAWKIAFADFATAMIGVLPGAVADVHRDPRTEDRHRRLLQRPDRLLGKRHTLRDRPGRSPQLAPERTINPEVKTEAPQEKFRSSATPSRAWPNRSSRNASNCC